MAQSTSVERNDTELSTATQIADAVGHLRKALAVVDRLMLDAMTQPSEHALYHHLGEASRSTHHALIALSECSEVSTVIREQQHP
jgi:hypothetical protein